MNRKALRWSGAHSPVEVLMASRSSVYFHFVRSYFVSWPTTRELCASSNALHQRNAKFDIQENNGATSVREFTLWPQRWSNGRFHSANTFAVDRYKNKHLLACDSYVTIGWPLLLLRHSCVCWQRLHQLSVVVLSQSHGEFAISSLLIFNRLAA